ncbi:MAG TPA: phospho-sugar mutase [Streptosporangiaceae bacterium]|nr:phospho-sugar mutase [Streptosporangiaceae bacterium]
MIPAGLRARVAAWIREDPDPGDRAELQALLAACDQGGEPGRAALAELTDRFAGRLQFGTAGLRGQVGAGPNRMNRAVVRAATAALAGWLRERGPGAAQADGTSRAAGAAGMAVVIGCDARHRSAVFADEAAAVLTGAGIAVHLLPRPGPTPLLAFAVRHLAAAAGIMITASHNPAADNGYKLYLDDGAQIVPPVDAQIEAAIARLGPLSQIPAGPLDGPLATWHGDDVAQAYLDAIIAAFPRPLAGAPRTGATVTDGLPASGPPNGGPQAGTAQAGAPSAGGLPAPGQPVAAQPGTSAPAGLPPPRVVYSPLHGVAAGLALRAIERAGFPPPLVVAAQAEPDPGFPTLAFPNPEEPGTLDLALAQAARDGADLVLANDPDGDRLAVAVPDPGAPGAWRVLTGDQVGALIGSYLLERTAAEPRPGWRLVVTTVVSSTLLAKIAASAGVSYAQTLTGFKWIVRAGQQVPGTRFLFGYEEALGYAVGDVVRDKDGISAALAVLSLATTARAAGRSLLDRWDALEAAHGVHLTAQVTLHAPSPAAIMGRLRAAPPAALAGQPVTGSADLAAGPDGSDGPGGPERPGRPGGTDGTDTAGAGIAGVSGLPPADVLIYRLPGARVVIRPSGTEPKLKAYLEIVEPATARTLAAARAAAAARLGPLRRAVADLVATASAE